MLTVEELAEENKRLRSLAIFLLLARGGMIDIHDEIAQRYNPADYRLEITRKPEFREVVVRARYDQP